MWFLSTIKMDMSENSTVLEIGYAAACSKPLYAFSKFKYDELCRAILFQGIISTPAKLVEWLK